MLGGLCSRVQVNRVLVEKYYYYAILITASQFLDKPCDVSANVAQSVSYKFAAISHYISETVQDSASVTIVCEYEVLCNLSNGVISSDLEQGTFQ